MSGGSFIGQRFDARALLTIAAAALVLGYAVIDVAYRLGLPTDGWEVGETAEIGFVYHRNLSGQFSPLQEGDHVLALNGIPADYRIIQESDAIRAAWQPGAEIAYSVLRNGSVLVVPVTLEKWEFRAWAGRQFPRPIILAGLLSNSTLFALAAAVFLRRPENLSAGPFLLITAMLAGSSISETLPSGFAAWIDPGANFSQQILGGFLLTSLFPYAFIRFAMVFPKPSAEYSRFGWSPLAAGIVGLLLVLGPTASLSWLWFVFSLVLGVGLLVRNAFVMRDPVSRAQIRWGVGGVLAGMGTITALLVVSTSGVVPIDEDLLAIVPAIGTTLMGAMLGIGISRFRLFDVDVLIRLTLQYAILTGMLAFVYLGGVTVLQGLLNALTGDQESPLVTVLTTLAIAALFNPLRRTTQRWIDHRFFRAKYDAEQELDRFARTARDEVDLDRLAETLLEAVGRTLQPARASLWILHPPGTAFRQEGRSGRSG